MMDLGLSHVVAVCAGLAPVLAVWWRLRAVLKEHTAEKVRAAVHEAEQDARLKDIERRLDRGDKRFASVEETLAEIKTTLASINTILARMDQRLSHLEARNDG